MLRRRPIMRMAATTAVVAGTATAVSGRVNRRQQNKYAQQDEAAAYEQQQAAAAQAPAYAPPAAPAPAPAPAGMSMDAMNELKELAALKDQGILTDDEFAVQKARILG